MYVKKRVISRICLTVEITIWLSVNYLYVQLLIMLILSE